MSLPLKKLRIKIEQADASSGRTLSWCDDMGPPMPLIRTDISIFKVKSFIQESDYVTIY